MKTNAGVSPTEIVRRAASFRPGRRPALTCAAACRIAEKHGIPLATIGRICDREGIRIGRCRLGCFQ
jgi:hypothetical protein